VGPSLKGLFQRSELRNGKAVTEKNIRSRIEQGGDGMPAFSELLSDKEKIDLISYLKRCEMAGPLVDHHPMTVSMDEKTRLSLFRRIPWRRRESLVLAIV
jgi:hypothetical protein